MSNSGSLMSSKQSENSTSLWFKPEKFLDPDFNAETYVQDLQRYVPLDSIRDELGKHLHTLQNRLVEVVNEDYMNFVNLSTNLVDVDAAVTRLQRPILAVKAEIEASRSAVAAKADQLQDGLARRQAAAANRALLELAQDAAHVVSKVEKLLEEVPLTSVNGHSTKSKAGTKPGHTQKANVGGGGEDMDELEARCRLLDRICSEVSRLNFYLAKGEAVPLMKHMEPRAVAATKRLQAALDVALRATLKVQNPAAMGVLIHAYASLGKPDLMESIVREELIEPLVTAATEKCGSLPSFPGLLQGILGCLKEEVGGFLEYVMSPAAGAQAFDFLGGSILPAVLFTVESKVSGAFSPGIPDAFCTNYKEAVGFVVELEKFAVTTEQVKKLRGSAAYQAYFGKWNLPAYFSLRFRDIAGGLEDQLATAGLAPSPSTASGKGPEAEIAGAGAGAETDKPRFAYAATAATWAALEQCISGTVFLPPLADRLLRVSLQLLARYATWINDGLKAAAEQAALEEQQQQHQAATADGQQGQQSPRAAAPTSWASGATIDQLAALWQDVDALVKASSDIFVPKFLALIGTYVQEGGAVLGAAFGESSSQLGSASEAVIQASAAVLTERCCVALKQLRGIVATFRMANRAAPTRASHYVVTILAPLSQSLNTTQGPSRLPAATKQHLTKVVVQGIAARYQQLAEDTLSTVRKTEDSLRRLKYRKVATPEGGETEGAAPMDTDKLISMQLFLDVQEFGRQLKRLGLVPADLPGFKTLWEAVAPPEKVEELALL